MPIPNFLRVTGQAIATYPYALGVVVLVAFGVYTCGLPHTPSSQTPAPAPKEHVAVNAQVNPMDTLALQLADLKNQTETQKTEMGNVLKDLKEASAKFAAAEKASKEEKADLQRQLQEQTRRMKEELDRAKAAAVKVAVAPQAKPAPAPKPTPPPSVAPGTPHVLFQMRTLRADPQRRPAPPQANAAETPYLPVGCFADIKVVTGVMATSQVSGDTFGNPVLVVVTSPFTCPSRLGGPGLAPRPSGIELTGAFALGKAKADMAASRVQGSMEMLSMVMPNGHALEQPIKGYLVGRDRRQGLYGKLEHHESAKVAQAFIVGLIEEAAKLFQAAQAKVLVAGTGYSGYGGIQTTLNQVGQLMLEQARALTPTLTVESEEQGYLVLLEPFALPDYPTFSYLQKGIM